MGLSAPRRASQLSMPQNAAPPAMNSAQPNNGDAAACRPSGTRTSATAATRTPPPNAITQWRSSLSIQVGRIRSALASAPPSGIPAPAPAVNNSI